MDTASQALHSQASDDRSRIFAIVAASSGNLVEWVDVDIY
jgi:hypothetical protein